jgi:hypothetical protein
MTEILGDRATDGSKKGQNLLGLDLQRIRKYAYFMVGKEGRKNIRYIHGYGYTQPRF